MRERRKRSQPIVWLCHRKLFVLRIVLHLQIPPSSTSLCFKSCWGRCHGNWVARHCPGDGRARLSGPRGAFLRQGNLRASAVCAALPFPSDTPGSEAEGTLAPSAGLRAAGRARSARCRERGESSGERDVSFGFQLHRPKTSPPGTGER